MLWGLKGSVKLPALIFDFDTVETLDEYQKSQLHMEFGEFVYSIRIDRACIDYEIGSIPKFVQTSKLM